MNVKGKKSQIWNKGIHEKFLTYSVLHILRSRRSLAVVAGHKKQQPMITQYRQKSNTKKNIFSFQILSAVGKDTVEIVMKLVLNQFTEDMFVLPAPLCTLFKSLEQRCSSKGIKTPHYCVAVKVCYLFSLDVFTAAIAWDHWQDTHS